MRREREEGAKFWVEGGTTDVACFQRSREEQHSICDVSRARPSEGGDQAVFRDPTLGEAALGRQRTSRSSLGLCPRAVSHQLRRCRPPQAPRSVHTGRNHTYPRNFTLEFDTTLGDHSVFCPRVQFQELGRKCSALVALHWQNPKLGRRDKV